MKASRFHIVTLKEAPSDAEVASHRLMTRAGMIRKLAGGIYSYMPMGLRVIRKIEAIVREEMNRAGAIELLMPVVQPAELWMESGRWEKYGPELLRVKDRHGRDFVVQPTSEEVITDIARQELRSYKQLPRNLYHIQTKFRDERRPRFGIMRGREFTMKDAYSFDRDRDGALASYQLMYEAYVRAFERMGLAFRPVAADTGAIGGSASHEFQVIADTGEDAIAWCPDSDFAANVELAEALPLGGERAPAGEALVKAATPDCEKCEAVAGLLGLPLERTVKSIVLAVDRRGPVEAGAAAGAGNPAGPGPVVGTDIWLLLIRGDHELNEVKVGKLPGLAGFRFATEAEIVERFGSPPGYLGPVGAAGSVTVVADRTVAAMSDFVCGANEAGFHYTGVNWGRDLPEPVVADLRNVQAGDPSPDGRGVLAIQRGIEVGHVFYLGTTYSAAMNATFIDEDGKSRPFEMGCYGIGITRLAGAAIEQNHDDRGIVWPRAIAPFEVVICPLGYRKSERVRRTADALYAELQAAGVDVLLDDRDERPGVMFADWELIGVPLRITVGERSLADGKIELLARRDMASTAVSVGDALPVVRERLAG
ncbi:MAG: proline--tRNA ligase [Burkholderiaceae bacterium]